MAKPTILLFFILCNLGLRGQIQIDVQQVLTEKSLVALDAFVNKIASDKENHEKRITASNEYLRDVVNDYREGIYYFERDVKDPLQEGVSRVYNYRVTVLTKDTVIIYYELGEEKNKKVNGNWEPYFDPIEKFRNDTAVAQLKKSFEKAFSAELNEGELFQEKFTYGRSCGEVGREPQGKIQIDKWVKKKDRHSLEKWLQSTNLEKQMYAVDGLFQLRKAGLKLSNEEKAMIKIVLSKKGVIGVCYGCVFSWEDISAVARKFKN